MKTWNKPQLQRHYLRVLDDATMHGYFPDELESPYLTKLSHQTKGRRIMRMVTLAYYLGKLKGISEVDEGYTPITMRNLTPSESITAGKIAQCEGERK